VNSGGGGGCARERLGLSERVQAGLKRELGNVGHDMADFLGVHVWARSAVVAGRIELTGRVHGAATQTRM
jgi:hypothetical protein